jgi:hypothetical protein
MKTAWVLLLAGMLVQVGMGKTKCVTTRGADGIETRCIGWDAPKPEALDVPAIQELRRNPLAGVPCGAPSISPSDCVTLAADAKVKVWTCSDKERILLTAEDGSKHCVKFPKEVK